MKVRVLGSAGSEAPGRNLPAFLVDSTILLDAGTISLSLTGRQQKRIREIFITHAHLDHILAIPFFLDNMSLVNAVEPVTVTSGRDVIAGIRKNLLNDVIWPDFTKIPDRRRPVLKFKTVSPSRPRKVDGYTVRCERMTHTVPAYGYLVTDRHGDTLAYTGDTGPTDRFWRLASAFRIGCLIIEVSFPDRLADLARLTGHLTPEFLRLEIAKLPEPPRKIAVTHTKPPFIAEVMRDLRRTGLRTVSILKDGQIISV